MADGLRSQPRHHLAALPRTILGDPFARTLLLVSLGALALRLAAVARYGGTLGDQDSRQYLDLGRLWADGHGLGSSAEISAGYPMFVGAVDAVRRLLGEPFGLPIGVAVVQAFLGAATVGLVGVVGRRVGQAAVGLASAALVAIWPNLVFSTVTAMQEVLCTFLLVAFVAVLGGAKGTPSLARLATSAALLALAAEVRATSVLLVALFAFLPASLPRADRVRTLALGTALTLLVILPFAARSTYVAHTFVPFDLRAGTQLCLARTDAAMHDAVDWTACPRPLGIDAVSANRATTKRAMQLLRAHPGREPYLVYRRLRATLWSPDSSAIDGIDYHDRLVSSAVRGPVDAVSSALSRVVLLLAVLGSVWPRRRRLDVALPVLAGWLLLVPVVVSLGLSRYRMPSVPFFCIVAVAFLATFARPGRSAVEGGAEAGDHGTDLLG